MSRCRHEASSLHAVQSAAWHSKLHELGVDYWTRGLDHPRGGPVDHPGGGAVDPVPVVGVADPAITHKFFGRATAVTALHQPSAPPTVYQHLT